jgi:hypothetical protein
LCRRLAQAGRQTVLQHFTIDRMVKEIEDFLQEVMNGARWNNQNPDQSRPN